MLKKCTKLKMFLNISQKNIHRNKNTHSTERKYQDLHTDTVPKRSFTQTVPKGSIQIFWNIEVAVAKHVDEFNMALVRTAQIELAFFFTYP